MKIIGFVGPKGSGKDTAALLLKESGRALGKISFAGPLKEICSKVFGIPTQVLNDPILKEKELKEPVTLNKKHFRAINLLLEKYLPPIQGDLLLYRPQATSIASLEGRVLKSPREIMQIIGTDYIRNKVFGEWHMQAAFSPSTLSELKDGVYCVTDVRFLNEFEYLTKSFGSNFVCFYVDRPEAEERLAEATHPSELEVKKIRELLTEGQIIKNHGTIDELKVLLKGLELPKEAKASSEKKKKGFVFKEVGNTRK